MLLLLNVLILEDEYNTRKYLEKVTREEPRVDRVIDTDSGMKALEIVKEEQIDLMLLDIEIPGRQEVNGLELAKKIHAEKPEINFVFITAYAEFALESFKVHPFDYLIKPVDEERLKKTLEKLTQKTIKEKAVSESAPTKDEYLLNNENKKSIFIEEKREFLRLPMEDIIFIEKEKQGKRTIIHTKNKSYYTTKTLQELEKELNSNFLRVHRSYIVNKDKVTRIMTGGSPRSYTVELKDTSKTAEISRYRLEEVKKALR